MFVLFCEIEIHLNFFHLETMGVQTFAVNCIVMCFALILKLVNRCYFFFSTGNSILVMKVIIASFILFLHLLLTVWYTCTHLKKVRTFRLFQRQCHINICSQVWQVSWFKNTLENTLLSYPFLHERRHRINSLKCASLCLKSCQVKLLESV